MDNMPRLLQVGALSSQAARLQDLLTAHPAVASARVVATDGDADATILPRSGALVVRAAAHRQEESLLDFVNALLKEGELREARIVHRPEELPDASHERVVLSDLLQTLHARIDANGDGRVTRAELQAFLEANRLSHLTPHMQELSPESLSFAEFKSFLLDTRIVSLGRCDERQSLFGAHATLVGLVGECFFDHADADGDGTITLAELEALFERHGLGGPAAAKRAFRYHDANDDRAIDRDEFLALLLDEGLVTYELANTFLHDI